MYVYIHTYIHTYIHKHTYRHMHACIRMQQYLCVTVYVLRTHTYTSRLSLEASLDKLHATRQADMQHRHRDRYRHVFCQPSGGAHLRRSPRFLASRAESPSSFPERGWWVAGATTAGVSPGCVRAGPRKKRFQKRRPRSSPQATLCSDKRNWGLVHCSLLYVMQGSAQAQIAAMVQDPSIALSEHTRPSRSPLKQRLPASARSRGTGIGKLLEAQSLCLKAEFSQGLPPCSPASFAHQAGTEPALQRLVREDRILQRGIAALPVVIQIPCSFGQLFCGSLPPVAGLIDCTGQGKKALFPPCVRKLKR